MKTTHHQRGLLALALLASVASLAAQQTPEPTIARARAALQIEHNPTLAAKIYQQIVDARSTSANLRGRAWLELAGVRRRLGDIDGAREALEQAAAGGGEIAERAREQQAAASDEVAFVRKLIDGLKAGTDPKATEQLLWVGARAVPELIDAVEREAVDMAFVTAASDALMKLGGTRVERWLGEVAEKKPALYRLAVIRAYRGSAAPWTALEPFVSDSDPRVVTTLLTRDARLFERSHLIEMLRSDNATLRDAAMDRIMFWDRMRSTRKPNSKRELLDVIQSFGSRAAECRLDAFAQLDTHEDRELFIEACGLPDVRGLRLEDSDLALGESEHLDSLRTLLKALPSENRKGRLKALRGLIRCGMRGWGATSIDVFGRWCETAGQVERNADDYLRRMGEQGALDEVYRLLARFGGLASLSGFGFEPTLAHLETLENLLTDFAAAGDAHIRDAAPIVAELGKIDEPEAYEAIAKFLIAYWPLPKGVGPNVHSPTHQEYLSLTDPILGSESQKVRSAVRILALCDKRGLIDFMRHDALMCGLSAGDQELVGPVVQAYSSGDASHPLYVVDDIVGSFTKRRDRSRLRHGRGRPQPRIQTTAGPSEVLRGSPLVEAMAQILASGSAAAWDELLNALRPSPSAAPRFSVLPAGARAALLEVQASMPAAIREAVLTEWMSSETLGVEELAMELLDSENGEIRAAAVTRLTSIHEDAPQTLIALAGPLLGDDSGRVVRAAVVALGAAKSPKSVELLVPLLDHDSISLRSLALSRLRSLAPQREVEFALRSATNVASLSNHRAASLAEELCETASSTLDTRMVPSMLELMRSSSSGLRERVSDVLERIRLYRDERGRWERIMSASASDAPSAAEALVRQVRNSKKPEVRRLAVQSLGTVGVAETLPFLISLLDDSDPAIVAAARAAITKINGASK